MKLQQMFAATFSVFALASSWLSLLPAIAADVEPTILQQLSPIGWHALGYSPDGSTLVAGDDSRGDLPKGGSTVKVWELASKQTIRSLPGHQGPVTEVCYSPDGRTLASVASYDTKIKIWDSASGRLLKTLNNPKTTLVNYALAAVLRHLTLLTDCTGITKGTMLSAGRGDSSGWV